MFHSLIDLNLPADSLIEKVNRLFCESTLSTHYTTLICGYANNQGELEIVNAGHWPALLIRNDEFEWIGATGMPLGLFCNGNYTTRKLKLEKNDTLILYTDGLIEATHQQEDYGESRVEASIPMVRNLTVEATVNHYLEDLRKFLNGSAQNDDLTIMAIKWQA
jgi:sigma-B regulation protein RsbU (phosphoserine phosphatase)